MLSDKSPFRTFAGFIDTRLTRRFISNPIFVIGVGRSGTSVLLQNLGEHPRILAARDEAPFVSEIAQFVSQYLRRREESEYFARYVRIDQDDFFGRCRQLLLDTVFGPLGCSKLLAKALVRSYSLSSAVKLLRKTHWAAKCFPDREQYDALVKLFPNARFVHIVRKGCDVVYSMTKFRGFRDRLKFSQMCDRWVDGVEKYRYVPDVPQATRVRHERMVDRSEQFFQELFDFLNIDAHDGPLRYVETTLVNPLDEPTKKGVAVSRILRERPKMYMEWSDKQKAIFRGRCSAAMAELGYEIPF